MLLGLLLQLQLHQSPVAVAELLLCLVVMAVVLVKQAAASWGCFHTVLPTGAIFFLLFCVFFFYKKN
jgi:hypothetical protein